VPDRIDSPEALDEAFGAPAFLLLKHSHRCGISRKAFAEFEEFLKGGGGVRGAFIDVVGDRDLSLETARRTGIAHESPQAILLRGGNASWHANHFDITCAALRAASTR